MEKVKSDKLDRQAIGTDVVTLENANIVAFLVYMGDIAFPYIMDGKKNTDGSDRIAWDIEGKDVKYHIELYYRNYQVGIMDYVNNLQGIRSGMYNVRTINQNQIKEEIKK